jgi:sugar/nucleoside kinase (ribokinase family)
MRTLCLGEALVDLVCERPVSDFAQARAFVPHAGGAVANAAVVAARCGADVVLAGGAGDDAWGTWLERRLAAEGVDLRWFARPKGVETPLAFVTVNDAGEPSFAIYGASIADVLAPLEDRIEEAIAGCDALFFSSNSMVSERERELTLTARGLALRANKPVLFDPNLRLHRWPDAERATQHVRSVCEGALLVKVNRPEAHAISGEAEPETAAQAICELGAEVAIVTLGANGALARGAASIVASGPAATVVDTTGGGDVVAGVLLAALAANRFDPGAIADALPVAVECASRSVEGWGAIDALPVSMPRFV